MTWYSEATLICDLSRSQASALGTVYYLLLLGPSHVVCFHWDFRRQDLPVLGTLGLRETSKVELLAVHWERYSLAVILMLCDLGQVAPLLCLHNSSAQ